MNNNRVHYRDVLRLTSARSFVGSFSDVDMLKIVSDSDDDGNSKEFQYAIQHESDSPA